MARIGRIILSLLAFGAISAISLIGLSRHLEDADPQRALALFPLNVEALLHEAAQRLACTPSDGRLDNLEKQARLMLSFNPGDARLHSLIGEIQRCSGRPDQASATFERALVLAPTEVHALQWALSRTLQSGDAPETLDRIDALFRRWPDRIPSYAPVIPQAFAAPEPYDMLVRRIERSPPWRTTLISRLARDPVTLAFSAQLIEELATRNSAVRTAEISNVLNALINARLFGRAYRTFVLTLTTEQQAVMGNVYNGRFALPPSGRPFDWQIHSHPGVVFSFPETATDLVTSGLTLRFLQLPVRGLQVRQYTLLASGHHSFNLRVTAKNARLPKGLFWTIQCVASNEILSEVPIAEGSYRDRHLSADLTIPPEKCPLQLLHLSTKAIANNWNDLYDGSVTFDALAIGDGS